MGPLKENSRQGAQHARAFYEKWEAVQKAVCLCAAGVAWKGARIGVVLTQSDQIDWRGELEEEALRELLPNWFIDGQTTLTLSSQRPIRLAPPGTLDSFEVIIETAGTPPSEESGLTLLWPACSNLGAIERMREQATAGNPLALQVLRELLGYACLSLGLPLWALEPQTASKADAQAVQYGLHWYGVFVSRWREDFEHSLCWRLRELWRGGESGLYSVFLEWNREWFPDEAFRRWQGVYESFARCGLTLVRFGQEYAAQLREFVESGLLPRSILAGWEELGL